MPKALQKRGRRMKRKHDDDVDVDATHGEVDVKRQKPNDDLATDPTLSSQQYDSTTFFPPNDDMSAAYPPAQSDKAFFGMLDEEEQEFFKRADHMLDADAFGNPEERTAFVTSIFNEADGKELKIAQSQSCSRVLEKLIRVANRSQLKNLFQKFSGNFLHLLSHRFASHCCETLFTVAAPHVSEELKAKPTTDVRGHADDVYVSVENLFLHTLAELEGSFGFLLTERYASHALRILLLVLAGEPISTESMKTLLASKRKEGVSSKSSGRNAAEETATEKSRSVPASFATALEKLISDSVAGLDTAKLRALATHPNANPTLQLLLTLELTHYGKQRGKDERSIIRTLLPDDPFTAETESAAFISGLVYDQVGSHLVERIIEHAPAKLFKNIYKNLFKERLASYARNEVATHVVCRILGRLGYDDLLEAHEILLPVVPTLLQKQWTALTRTLLERCTVRDIDTQAVAVQIEQYYASDSGFDIARMLGLKDEASSNGDSNGCNMNGSAGAGAEAGKNHFVRPQEPTKVHFNILAQAMLTVPGSLSALILDALIGLEPATLLKMAEDHIITRTLQQALTTKTASMIQRRKLIQRFYGHIGEMTLDKSASHVVDCIWEGTHGLAFIRERIAEELAENEAALRDSPCGRAVWKNWKMDIYKRRRREWIRQSRMKASNDGFQTFSELESRKADNGPRKTPLQLARERHVQVKSKQEQKERAALKGEERRGSRG